MCIDMYTMFAPEMVDECYDGTVLWPTEYAGMHITIYITAQAV